MKNGNNKIDYDKIGFKNSDIDKLTFRNAFRNSKSSGKSSFNWRGNKYSTQTAEEKALGMTDKQLNKASLKASEKAKGFSLSKDSNLKRSVVEQANSYISEKQYRIKDKLDRGESPKGSAFAKKRPSRLKKK